ncbi:36928_t:CDS:2 [Gigaspora margarita]|uniref:36928_t:CDS:1 n=1 Tax=Gigaspora margarita TaxID=4874 RepID=A0ABN7WA28_GIGMA|nr:36928_t:CDS:2 [Gigaspora margarita]
MNQAIKTTYVDLNNCRILNYSEIDSDIVKISDIEIQRSAKDILIYLIPQLEKKGILHSSNPTIHLHVFGNRRNTGSKIKHVMVTFMILNDINNHHHADHHYITVLYSGTEKYDILSFILKPFLDDLRFLKNNGLDIIETHWNFKLYFSTDWKFLAINLEINYMENIAKDYKNFHSHTNLLIFDMITIENVIFNILHAYLCITDQLWSLILAKVKKRRLFNNLVWKIIKDEMHRLNISFNFWEIRETRLWNSTPLCSNNKIKFNLGLLFQPSRATLIQKL